MSLALFLFPLDHMYITHSGMMRGYSHTVLNVSDARRIDDVSKLVAESLPDGHEIYGLIAGTIKGGQDDGEHKDGRFDRDPYGDPYTWVRADKLAAVLRVVLHGDRVDPTDAYIAALPGDAMVILGWH